MLLLWSVALGALAACVLSVFCLQRSPPTVHGERTDGSHVSLPVVSGWLPFVGCGLRFIRHPRHFLEACRAAHGDAFVLHMFGLRLLHVFSPDALQALYRVRERDASFTEATRGLLSLKLPAQAITGSLGKFHAGLKRPLLATYAKHIDEAVTDSLLQLGGHGQLEVFAYFKQLVHRVGFLTWVGREALHADHLERFVDAFERLDPERGFSSPVSLFWTLATCKRREKRAIGDLQCVLDEIWRKRAGQRVRDNLDSLHELYADLDERARSRRIAIDIFQFHLASQANMYAALSWTLVNLLQGDAQHRQRVQREAEELVAALDAGVPDEEVVDLVERSLGFFQGFVLESLRLAQQSITLRRVMRPVKLEFDGMRVALDEGLYLSTLLSITNVDERAHAGDEHARASQGATPLTEFDPMRYAGSSDADAVEGYVLSTFGHGFHACPGRSLALLAMKLIFARTLTKLDLRPLFDHVQVPPASFGAIARATAPCPVQYSMKTS